MSEETHCPFCDVKYEEEFYSGSYDTYLAGCKCVTAKRYNKLKGELDELNEFIELKRSLRKLPVEIKNLAKNLKLQEEELLDKKEEVSERAKMLGIEIKE